MNKGKNLFDIPFDKVYIGMPVVRPGPRLGTEIKGNVVYKDSTDVVGKMFVIKNIKNGHFEFPYVIRKSLPDDFYCEWHFDMSREGEVPK